MPDLSPELLYTLIGLFYLGVVFMLGASIGSFINVVAARLPYEKSLIWPGSCCGSCHQPIAWYDNIPLISYLRLRGRCRACSQSFSISYFLVELVSGLLFAGLFFVEVYENVYRWPSEYYFLTPAMLVRWPALLTFAWHGLLMAFLLAASVCDIRRREIPLQITLCGTALGLVGATLMPWPWPWDPSLGLPQGSVFHNAWQMPNPGLKFGIYLWPVWGPIPDWLGPPGSWRLGLATGLAGAIVGSLMLRTIGFLFGLGTGKEGMGLGDADLMMMAGAFLGWQIVVVAFFVSVLPGIVVGFSQMLVYRDNSLPFGPSLAVGIMATVLGWPWLGPHLQPLFFWGVVMMLASAVMCGGLLFLSFAVRLMQR